MFHFSIRDVLWLTTLSAVLIAWWIDHTKARIDWGQVRNMERDLQSANEKVFWAEMGGQIARQQRENIVRAAALRGITQLDIEPETKIARPFAE